MRSCQICGESDRKIVFEHYDKKGLNLYACDACGHRYCDGDSFDQDWFDNYYAKEYRTSDNPYSADRWRQLSDFVKKNCNGSILDIGGKDGLLADYFAGYDYTAVGVMDDVVLKRYDCVILSHVLEHVYDVNRIIEYAKWALQKDGLLVIEVPVHIQYQEPTAYDYHFQHINKFRPLDLMTLLVDSQYSVVEYCELPDYLEYNCWRIAGRL